LGDYASSPGPNYRPSPPLLYRLCHISGLYNFLFKQYNVGTSIARVGDEYNPTEKNAPIDGRKSRIVGGIAGVVNVIDVAHFGRVNKRFVEESNSDDPTQLQVALNDKTFNIINGSYFVSDNSNNIHNLQVCIFT